MNVFTRQRTSTISQVRQIPLRRPWVWGLGAVSILILAIVLFFLHSSPPKAIAPRTADPTATVTTQIVGFSAMESHVTASGSIAPQHAVDLGAEVSGLKIIQVNVDEGDYVRKGQVLARLNPEILDSQLASQQAQLGARRATLSKARQPNRSEDIAGLRAALSQAEAAVTQAQANLQHSQLSLNNLRTTASRYDLLGKEGAISEQDALDKRAAANMAAADVEAAKQQLEAARFAATQARNRWQMAANGGRQEDVAISLSDLAQTQAAIRQVQAQLDQTIVRAPSDGLITKRSAEVGEISMAGQAMFSMTRDSRLELQAQVQEVDLPAVRAGQRVVITPASTELAPLTTSMVRDVSPRVDPRTRLGTVYITVLARSGLKEGMYANASISTGTHSALIVPTKSILAQEGGKFVFILNGDRVAIRSIQTGAVNGDTTEVLSGVQPGEQVVVAGAGFLKDGDRVNVQ
jgi:HlyD family secretion protein